MLIASIAGDHVTVAEMEREMGPEMTRKFRAHMAGIRAARDCPTYPDCEGDCYMRAYSAGMAP